MQDRTIYDLLNDRLDALATSVEFPAALTNTLHVLPYFHGNRSPRADPTLRGMISGLTLGDTIDDLALLYLATIQAVAHPTVQFGGCQRLPARHSRRRVQFSRPGIQRSPAGSESGEDPPKGPRANSRHTAEP